MHSDFYLGTLTNFPTSPYTQVTNTQLRLIRLAWHDTDNHESTKIIIIIIIVIVVTILLVIHQRQQLTIAQPNCKYIKLKIIFNEIIDWRLPQTSHAELFINI